MTDDALLRSGKLDGITQLAIMSEDDNSLHPLLVEVIATTPEQVTAKFGLTGKTGRLVRTTGGQGLSRDEILRLVACGWCRRVQYSQQLHPLGAVA